MKKTFLICLLFLSSFISSVCGSQNDGKQKSYDHYAAHKHYGNRFICKCFLAQGLLFVAGPPAYTMLRPRLGGLQNLSIPEQLGFAVTFGAITVGFHVKEFGATFPPRRCNVSALIPVMVVAFAKGVFDL